MKFEFKEVFRKLHGEEYSKYFIVTQCPESILEELQFSLEGKQSVRGYSSDRDKKISEIRNLREKIKNGDRFLSLHFLLWAIQKYSLYIIDNLLDSEDISNFIKREHFDNAVIDNLKSTLIIIVRLSNMVYFAKHKFKHLKKMFGRSWI